MVKFAANQARRPLIGILGGTFNPIHHGHLRMAEDLADVLKLDAVRFIPSANPPHKQSPITSAADRCEMVNLAIASNPRFILDDCELKREGASYTIDTLLSLREKLGKETALCLIMGSDAFAEFDSWHRWQEILTLCHLALVERPNVELSEALRPALQDLLRQHYTDELGQLSASPAGLISIQRITALDISATAIRKYLATQRSARYLMPDAVIDYIDRHHLYSNQRYISRQHT
ncbi:MAG: nicotinate-nucleotide adenylyltransferase [Methylophilaceae bacterium]|nr:nicotinate-nucleotide adenylyltransferase [Methylophilaceae bacterium]